jgi:hypothetical protein
MPRDDVRSKSIPPLRSKRPQTGLPARQAIIDATANHSVDEIPHAMKNISTKSSHFNGISFESVC